MNNFFNAIEKHRDRILAAERYLWAHPETGYREIESTKYLAEQFAELGYTLTFAEGTTGFYTVIDTGRDGPEVLVLAELDAVLCPAHKDADPATGAVHACGHHAQCAALLGIAAALAEAEVRDKLCGKIRLCAVPAEEPLELAYRNNLRAQGTIKYFSGKREFLSRGYFDGVDLALMVHLSTHFAVGRGAVGSLIKTVTYKGVAAHAGGAPQNGKNALYAATCGIGAVNAIRETFVESDFARVHAIITHGGETVGTIPARVEMESYVRGSNFDVMCGANRKVTAALCGGALSLGCNIEMTDMLGFAPLTNDAGMVAVATEAASLAHIDCYATDSMTTGSTDMGDLSCLMPVVHPYAAGAQGETHGADYAICDPETACVTNAKWQLAMLRLLLENGGARAKEIVQNFKPQFLTKESFFAYVDNLNASGERIVYRTNGTAEVTLG